MLKTRLISVVEMTVKGSRTDNILTMTFIWTHVLGLWILFDGTCTCRTIEENQWPIVCLFSRPSCRSALYCFRVDEAWKHLTHHQWIYFVTLEWREAHNVLSLSQDSWPQVIEKSLTMCNIPLSSSKTSVIARKSSKNLLKHGRVCNVRNKNHSRA